MRDINRKLVTKNAFRITKDRTKTALRIRIPGGELPATLLPLLAEIATTYGDGNLHMTTRQGFEITGIDYQYIEEINQKIQPIIDELDINQITPGTGYSAAGTRNIASCIGNKVCPKAAFNTTKLAKRIENEIFPHDFHFKIAVTGCPNDCIKARMHDFGIMGMAFPEYETDRCVSCNRCVTVCKKVSTGSLSMVNKKIVRDHDKCIGCGECVLHCPTGAWTRSEKKYYRLAIMGRTGKKNPRLAEDLLMWADEESIVKIIKNTYEYVDKYIDRKLPKEHIGYIVDRTGFEEWKAFAFKDVELDGMAKVRETVNWSGIYYGVR